MSKYTRNNLVAAITAFAVGAVYIDRQTTNLADPTQWPAAPASGDQIQIGVIPAGHVLVPHLSLIRVPELDSNASATGKFKLGTDAANTAVAVEQNAGGDIVLSGEDLVLTGTVGSQTDDTPIYLTLSAALATKVTTGKIVADLAIRSYRQDIDAA